MFNLITLLGNSVYYLGEHSTSKSFSVQFVLLGIYATNPHPDMLVATEQINRTSFYVQFYID